MESAERQEGEKKFVNDINDFSFLVSLENLPVFRSGRGFHAKNILSIMVRQGKPIVDCFYFLREYSCRGMRGKKEKEVPDECGR